MRVFAFLRVKDKLTPKECEEKAKRFLVSKAQQEDHFIQNIFDQLANQDAQHELGALKPFSRRICFFKIRQSTQRH